METAKEATKELFDADPIGYIQKNIEYDEQMVSYNQQMAQLQQVSQEYKEKIQIFQRIGFK